MSDKGTIEQLRAELAQAKTEAAGLGTALADTSAARDALARECNHLEEDREYNAALVTEKDRELAQLRRQLAIPDQTCGYCGYRYSAGTNEANFAVLAEHIKSCSRHPLAKALAELAQAQTECNVLAMTFTDANELHAIVRGELTQARAELKDLQVANQECGWQLAQRTNSRDYWVGKCQAAEIERDQIRKEAEGLRLQLKHAEDAHTYRFKEYDALEIDLCHAATGEAAIVEAAKALLKLSPSGVTRLALGQARHSLVEALEHRSEAAAKLLERLATLDDVEQRHQATIDELEQRLTRMRKRLAQAELAAHVHDKACGELAQTVRTERAERQEAEQETRRCNIALSAARAEAKATQTLLDNASAELSNGHGTLTLAGIPRSNEFGKLSITGRAIRLRQRAERAEALAASTREYTEALAAEVHAMLSCSPERPWHGCTTQTVCNEAHYHNHMRGARELLEKVLEGETPTNTQALAALVTEELAELLVRLGHIAGTWGYHDAAEEAHTLAARIREVLGEH